MTENTTPSFSTKAIHAGQEPDARTGAVIPPLHMSSTYKQDGVGGFRSGYEYSRSANPTRDALQAQLAAIEGGAHAFSFASGLAAEDALLRALTAPGDTILLGNDAYGGTFRLINAVFGQWGVKHFAVDLTNTSTAADAITAHRPKVVWVETPTNPLLNIVDIRETARLAHEAGAILVVDNTFATPYLQNPISQGADIVVHSVTKYLGGHSDVVGGALILADDTHAEAIGYMQNAAGAVSSPFDAWLTMRGIKTLAVRVKQHSENAAALAAALTDHPKVETVLYPGLESHRGHEVAARQMRQGMFGGMMSIQVAGGREAARRLVDSTEVFTLAESLGGIESLIEYPYDMTHASVQGTDLEVPVNLVRLSVGIEDVDDLLADLTQALDRL
ncbi:cystathionine gamma-synthase [uncultured Brevibacterium sp.]|uniref:cystathionine gamma-synthase n=1 Tax=uncultured Brevibacterium sp. TaxID=189678 RepID=UPI0025F1EB5E|nr:cystathionine gamma-synthase [uncultured Brevibacterium sp.]